MIQVRELTKIYRVSKKLPGSWRRERVELKALDGLSFDIGRGEIVGYIGPNGAGKSTTIKVLSGILHPDGGSCRVNGRVPWKERTAHVRELGVVFGQRTQLWWDLPALDSFDLLASMYGVKPARYRENLGRLRRELGLDEFLRTPVRQLSLGQRMRCELAAALVHEPPLLFLDEPTIGLDAPSKLAMRQFVLSLNRDTGCTVILTTHDMDDIEALASRVLLIGKGRALFDGSLVGLRAEAGTQRRLTLDLAAELPDAQAAAARALATLPAGVSLVSASRARLSFAYDPALADAAELVGAMARLFAVADLSIEGPSAEELVSALYRKHGV